MLCAATDFSLRQLAFSDLLFPFVHQRPINGADAKVSHVAVAFDALDRGIQQCIIFFEWWTVTGQQPLYVAFTDAFQRRNERGDIAAVMDIDRANAAVAINVVTAKQKIAHPK